MTVPAARAIRWLFVALALAIAMSACNSRTPIGTPEDAFARHCLDLIRTGQTDQAIALLDPAIRTTSGAALSAIHDVLNHGEPISVETAGASFQERLSGERESQYDFAYQLQFPDAWVLANVHVVNNGGGPLVAGVHAEPLSDSLEAINSLTMANKGLPHYVMILLAGADLALVLYCMILCIRTPMPRKWAWMICILVTVGKLRFNWTEGHAGFQPIAFMIGGVGLVRGGLAAPWMLSVSFPLGAFVFLLKKGGVRAGDPKEHATATRSP